MRKIIAIISLTLALLAWHGAVEASCTSTSYFLDGRIILCMTCCYAGHCTVTCS